MEYALDHRQPIDLLAVNVEVQCGHRAGAIDAHLDGNSLGTDAEFLEAELRTRQRGDHHRQTGKPHPGQAPFDAQRHGNAQGLQNAHVGEEHRHAALPADGQHADDAQQHEQQQP